MCDCSLSFPVDLASAPDNLMSYYELLLLLLLAGMVANSEPSFNMWAKVEICVQLYKRNLKHVQVIFTSWCYVSRN